jgi:phospholipase/carboxylesterase
MRILELAGIKVRLVGGVDREGGGQGPLVVLLHGYGAPGDDLVGLHRVLRVPREVRFAFPEAPLSPPDVASYGGRAWWPIDMAALQRAAAAGAARDRSLESPAGLPSAHAEITSVLDALVSELAVPPDQLLLGGFSQGAMLACDLALRTQRRLAGLILLSCTLLSRAEWQPLMAARAGLPVLLTHGRSDPLLPHDRAVELRDLMRQAGIDVQWYDFPGGHEVPSTVLGELNDFLTKQLGKNV